jgi:drug/metabolite transporter (DMT)-like permease
MNWLIVIIVAYFLLAVSALGDKYLLTGPPNPKSYSFYVGILGILILVLVPFVGFSIPSPYQVFLALAAGMVLILANFCYFTALEHFELSRIAPAIGGILPLFTFGFVFFFAGGKRILGWAELTAFILLILGSVFITFRKEKAISFKSLQLSALAAFLFALTFILTKYVYLEQSFWQGFFWMRIGGFLTALCFLLTPEIKREIFEKKFTFQKKTGLIFLANQAVGASAFLLQNWAIALIPLTFLPFINALEGTKYIFLLIFGILFSWKLPAILKEEISPKVILQKIIAILLIGAGLIILALK